VKGRSIALRRAFCMYLAYIMHCETRQANRSRNKADRGRCHRLEKECMTLSSMRKRAKRTTTSKRAQLEDKLDDLVSLLRTQTAPGPDRSTSFQANTPRSLSFSPQESRPDNSLTHQELTAFRQRHLPLFPMIYLPPSLSVQQLSLERPLVSLAIKTICNKGCSYQAELSKELRQTIAMKMMVEGEKSLDLLLSVLISTTW
jgi:hypothetical protein